MTSNKINEEAAEMPQGPLSGVRVLNIGTSIVGPWAASLLAHLGAEAIKVERPDGEFIRFLHPMQKGLSTCYLSSNNHQLSTEFDLKQPEQLALVQSLGHEADVLIENFRPGVSDRIGLGYTLLSQENPGLVYVSSSSWGDVGPMRDQAALDPHVQAFSGFGSLNGVPDGEPEMLRFVHMDPAGSAVVAGLTLLGLLQRERFGAGAHLKTSHFAMGIAMQMNRAAETLLANKPTELLGSASSASAPNQCFRMLGGEYIALACDTQVQWEGLCRALSQEDLIADQRFLSNVDRVENRQVLVEIIQSLFSKKPKRWWVVRLEKEGIPHGFNLDFEQLRHHQQVVENEFLVSIHGSHVGSMYLGGVPWQFSESAAHIDPQIAVPGEHTEQVKKEAFGDSHSTDKQTESAGENRAPLQGFCVIDSTQGYAGPYLGLLLAEAGAEVIKIEPPGGDWARQLAPQTATGNSALFEAFNRNKSNRVLDLDSEQGQQELRTLCKDADIFLEDWGPGIAEKRKLGYESLAAENPSLVYYALSAFGEKGPLRDQSASELTIQAMTGYLRLLGKLDEAPVRVGADIVATCTGSVAFIGVLAALYHREKSGRGQRVASSLLGAMMSIRSQQWSALSNPDEWLGDSYCTNETDSPHNGYRTKDGTVYMSPSPHLSREDFLNILKDFGIGEELFENPEFEEKWWYTFGMGYLARQAKPLWENHTSKLTTQEVMDILQRYNNVWAVEFADLGVLMNHPQVAAIDLVHDLDEQRYVRAPWRVPWTLPGLKRSPEL